MSSGPDYSKAVVMGADGALKPNRENAFQRIMQRLFEKTLYKKDARLLDPISANALGGAVAVRNPSIVMSPPSILTLPPGPTGNITFTPIFEARARNMSNPEVIAVTIANPNVGIVVPTVAPAEIDLKARIDWGAGGGQMTADVDIRHGTVISVLGTYLRVTVIATNIDASGNAASQINVGASVSYGTRPGSSAPPTWSGISEITHSTSVSFIIPPMARDVVVYASDLAAGNADLPVNLFFTSPSNWNYATIAQTVANGNPAYRIPPGANTLTVANPDGAKDLLCIPVFGLAF